MKGTQTLMHKGEKVATCCFDSRGYLKSISKVYNAKLLPICVGEVNPVLDLQRWILSRNLAANRKDIAPLREFYGSDAFLSDTGLSLFDCYWFANTQFSDWEKVNAYDNWDCKKDSLFLMFSHPDELQEINKNSPNLTIPGRNQKIWYRAGEDIYLLYGNAQQEMTEYKAANGNNIVAEREYIILAGNIYARKKADTNKDIERISLEDLYLSCQDPEKTKMQNLQICCEKYGLNNWRTFFTEMCKFDEVIENDARELCDVSILRNSNSLEIIDFAKL